MPPEYQYLPKLSWILSKAGIRRAWSSGNFPGKWRSGAGLWIAHDSPKTFRLSPHFGVHPDTVQTCPIQQPAAFMKLAGS